MERKASVEYWLENIKQSYQSKDDVLTASLVQLALSETDYHPRILEVAGMIAYTCGHIEDAIEFIERASFEIRLSISSQLTLANAWLSQGDVESAKLTLRFLVEVIERVPCSMLPDLTHALAKIEDFNSAIRVCRVAFERHPDDDNAVFGAAFYMNRAGYPKRLVYGVMARAIELDATSPVYRLNMACICCSLNFWDEAYTHACRLSPDELKTIPCKCTSAQMLKLFQRFGDQQRLNCLSCDE